MTEFPFRALIAALPVGVAVLDEQARVVDLNRAFERVTRIYGADVRGKSMFGTLVRATAGSEPPLLAALGAGRLDTAFELLAGEGRTIRLRGFEHDGRVWVLGTLEFVGDSSATARPDVDVLIDRVSTARHALNNVLMGLMGHAEILAGLREAPAPVRARGEALLDQCRRLREEIQRLELPAVRPDPAD